MTATPLKVTEMQFARAAMSGPYGRLSALLGLVEWTTQEPVDDRLLLPFIDIIARETGRGALPAPPESELRLVRDDRGST